MNTQHGWIAVLAALLAGAVPAEETPSIGRGLALDKLYQTGDIDSIDLHSGALAVAIPIGNPYPVSERFSYQFTLNHSSRVWDYDPATEGYWAYPNRRSNAGIGWALHFGLLIHPDDDYNPGSQWIYISPEGGEHAFFAELHNGEDDGDPTNLVEYTHDATYLRLKHLAGNVHEIEFPEGTIKTFEPVTSTTYRLTEIRDRFPPPPSAPQNWVRFAYPDALTWTVTDSRNRSHTVKFVSILYDGAARPMVDYADLAAFDGTPARWNFTYVNDGAPTEVYRDCQRHPLQSSELWVPVLASVVRPLSGSWSFTHYNDDPATFSCKQSELMDLNYPTGGSIHYGYATIPLPAVDVCPTGPEFPSPILNVLAVQRRTLSDNVVTNPSPPTSIWEYEHTWDGEEVRDICGDPQPEVLPPDEETVTVWSPAN